MYKVFSAAWIVAIAAIGLVSCSDPKDEIDEEFIQTPHIIKGKVEKGPLVRGSQIDMRTLDKSMVPTGNSYTTTIENNTGDFNYGSLKVNSPYAKLTADGYFFNEVNGGLSNSTIRLDAIVDLSDNTTVNVNVLTHLKSQRINYLVTNEHKSFKDANNQAQRELLTQFGLQEYASKDASQYSITSGDDAAGVLIAVSSLVLSDRSEAEVVEFLSLLTNEFSTTGTFSDKTKERFKSTRNYLNGKLDQIQDNIRLRYQDLGYDVNVKDLAYYFDWDNDGIAGNEIDDASDVQLSQNDIQVPAEGGDFTVKIESDKPHFLTPPSTVTGSDTGLDVTPGTSITPEYWFSTLYEEGTNTNSLESEKTTSIDNNVVKIHVGPAKSRKSHVWTVNIYNARGKVVAALQMSQQGNPKVTVKVPKLGKDGANAVAGVCIYLADAVEKERNLEGTYALNKQPYSSDSYEISNCWAKYYTAMRNLLVVKKADEQSLDCYRPFFNAYIALIYYQLSSHWGGVPFYMKDSDYGIDNRLPRTSENEVLSTLANLLNEALPDLKEKKNDSFSDANSMFFVSKDVARVLLAYIYCNQKKWNAALPLLEKVISNGYYSLIATNKVEFKNDSECIFGLIKQTRAVDNDGKACIPCLDYREVVLTAAECLYHTGKTAKAKEYVDLMSKKKRISVDGSDLLKSIATLRYKLQLPNYLTFIRRNDLGASFMGLNANKTYQLLWPIPSSECNLNPNMTQNPGYSY